MITSEELTARMEPFDSFWEGPRDIEKGYGSFYRFYKYNYLKHMPDDRNARILVISCGPGYFVNMLNKEGYSNVLGIDSFEEKIGHAKRHGLNCEVARAFEFLQQEGEPFDAIFCEQELNHLTKAEILSFLELCWKRLSEGGRLVAHGLNGANPITGSEALAQNFDHYNTFTEYTFGQVLEYTGFRDIQVFPLNLYVFWTNPLNYVLIALSSLYTLFFRVSFIMYGKSNKLFTKKIGAVCRKATG
ncbi:MAG TPA: class I SAM-dependent methyltransferase [Gammaproteobacteria bacterium]|nr:class I SAM-dependent methyltransferase [Gammaproteobacteria bacterium]